MSDRLPSLEELGRKLQEHLPTPEPEEPTSSMGDGMRAGTEVIAGVLVGTLLGYLLDQGLDTMPWFMIVGVFLGFAAGFRNLIRNVK